MKNKAETICVLISGYIATLTATTFIYLIITKLISLNLLNQNFDQGAAIIGILGWSATIYTAVVAGYLFSDWREQKKYELEKQYAEEIIININKINKNIDNLYFKITAVNREIKENFVALNSVKKELCYNNEDILTTVLQQAEIFEIITCHKIKSNKFNEYENHTILFNRLIQSSLNIYQKYYNVIPTDIKEKEEDVFKNKNDKSGVIVSHNLYAIHEQEFLEFLNPKNKIPCSLQSTDNGEYILYKLSFEEFHLKYKEKYYEIINMLSDMIIPK